MVSCRRFPTENFWAIAQRRNPAIICFMVRCWNLLNFIFQVLPWNSQHGSCASKQCKSRVKLDLNFAAGQWSGTAMDLYSLHTWIYILWSLKLVSLLFQWDLFKLQLQGNAIIQIITTGAGLVITVPASGGGSASAHDHCCCICYLATFHCLFFPLTHSFNLVFISCSGLWQAISLANFTYTSAACVVMVSIWTIKTK